MSNFYTDKVLSNKTKVDIIFENQEVVAFYHTRPYWEYHAVIIPKQHIIGLPDYPNSTSLSIAFFEAFKFATQFFEEKHGGCRICSNVGTYQSTKYLHWYVHFGKRLTTENGNLIT